MIFYWVSSFNVYFEIGAKRECFLIENRFGLGL